MARRLYSLAGYCTLPLLLAYLVATTVLAMRFNDSLLENTLALAGSPVAEPVFSIVPEAFMPGGLSEEAANEAGVNFTQDIDRAKELLTEAGVPPGVVNMVNGRGQVTGDALVRHPQVRVVSFTGGTATGRSIAAAASPALKRVDLELGGKSANIITETAVIDDALDGALTSTPGSEADHSSRPWGI